MHPKKSYHKAINTHWVLFKNVRRLFEGSLSMLFMFQLKSSARLRAVKCPVSVAARILMYAGLVRLTVGLRVINGRTLNLHSSWNC